MTILQLIVLLIVVGVLLALVNSVIPMDAKIKRILNIVVVTVIAIIALVWVLGFLGLDLNSSSHRIH